MHELVLRHGTFSMVVIGQTYNILGFHCFLPEVFHWQGDKSIENTTYWSLVCDDWNYMTLY